MFTIEELGKILESLMCTRLNIEDKFGRSYMLLPLSRQIEIQKHDDLITKTTDLIRDYK